MKILLVSAIMSERRQPVFPLGLAYLSASLRQAGHQIGAFDVHLHKDYLHDLKQAVSDFHPDAIGVSMRNLDNQRYNAPVSYISPAKSIVNACREVSTARIIIGGSGYSIAPGPLLDYLGADYGIIGEGENALVILLRTIETGAE
ncbi:MAG: cobalamin-dependent protein, partial [Dehalococcoidales bacterium]|nr:cobalamin-dependent protein [Dehalococcoidales bacterium]